MTLTQLEYALAIEEHLNFQKAADACRVAQPSLSAQIKKLEAGLGVTLFLRSSRSGVTITEVGRRVLDQARQIVTETQTLEDTCKNFRDEISGTLRVGVIPTIGPFLVPLFLSRLRHTYPALKIELTEDSTKALIEALHFGHVDAAILSPPKKTAARLMDRLLYFEPFMAYASEGHPLLDHKKVKQAELTEYKVTLLDETHCMRDQVLSACASIQQGGPSLTLKQGSLQTLVALVDAEKGYTLIPKLSETILHFSHGHQGLRPVILPTPFRKVSLIYRHDLVRKKLVEALYGVIRKALPDTVYLQSVPGALVIDASKDHFQIEEKLSYKGQNKR